MPQGNLGATKDKRQEGAKSLQQPNIVFQPAMVLLYNLSRYHTRARRSGQLIKTSRVSLSFLASLPWLTALGLHLPIKHEHLFCLRLFTK